MPGSAHIQNVQRLIDEAPFHSLLNLKCVDADPEHGTVKIEMPANQYLMRSVAGRQFHGGAIASLVDVSGDMAIAMGKEAVPTINFRVDYLRPSGGNSFWPPRRSAGPDEPSALSTSMSPTIRAVSRPWDEGASEHRKRRGAENK